ncbi:MAG TPA: metallophosphoesterase family protein [Planctomycetes bacterium]|nr:metallophosphoesterase family protein [Planctomycetota bacterium]
MHLLRKKPYLLVSALLFLGSPLLGQGQTVFVPAGATWKYNDNGKDLGTNWRSPTYNDSAWKSGKAQLGYGDGDEATTLSYGPNSRNKYPTYYFRKTFQVSAPTNKLWFELLRDDGAVIYLNGIEVLRSNMPSGSISYGTFASSTVSGKAESTFFRFPINAAFLKKGTNTLAVELHQRSPTSSDISFDLKVWGDNSAVSVVRGPYLQRVTQRGLVIRWRTDVPSTSGVWVGRNPTLLKRVASDSQRSFEHEIPVGNLGPGTSYVYAIGTDQKRLLGGSAAFSFRTSTTFPVATRIWVVGDSGTGGSGQRAVRDGFLKFEGGHKADLWLMLGDNAYWDGKDQEYQSKLFVPYRDLLRRLPLWPTYGNHDGHSANSLKETGPYYDIFTLPRKGEAGGVPSGTEAYYSFDYSNIHLICLNSYDLPRGPSSPMAVWLKKDLAATKALWKIAYWHHPPYSKGSHDSDRETALVEMRKFIVPLLENGGVDLVLCGHSHGYERSYLMDGHYGFSSTFNPSFHLKDKGDGDPGGDGGYWKLSGPARQGTVYVVAGNGARVSTWPRYDHPALPIRSTKPGSLVLDIKMDRLLCQSIDSQGRVFDRFEIKKGAPPLLSRDNPRLSLSKGGMQTLSLQMGARNAGAPYFVLGSLSTSPGFSVAGVHVPLNPDPWFLFTLNLPNTPPLLHTLGFLDSTGRQLAGLFLPKGSPSYLLGLSLYHAAVVFQNGVPVLASNPVRLKIER